MEELDLKLFIEVMEEVKEVFEKNNFKNLLGIETFGNDFLLKFENKEQASEAELLLCDFFYIHLSNHTLWIFKNE